MRVIAGKARRLALKTIPGPDTRPTTDRIKETLFNILRDRLYDVRFLDLFAGSGAIGIEALSRGAREAVFVEKNPAAVQCIRDNLRFTGLEAGAFVMQSDVFAALRSLEKEAPFDLVFLDPPYQKELERRVLAYLAGSSVIGAEALVIVEASLQTDFSYLEESGFRLLRRKEYKTNVHMFLQKRGSL